MSEYDWDESYQSPNEDESNNMPDLENDNYNEDDISPSPAETAQSNDQSTTKKASKSAASKLEKQSTYPITLKPAAGHTLLVELHDPNLSLINDTGVIGRFMPQPHISTSSSSYDSASSRNDRIELDLKGHIYSGELHTCPTVWIVVQTNNECRVESAIHTVASVYKQHETLREEVTGDLGDMDDDEYNRPMQVDDSDDEFTDGKKKKKTAKSPRSSTKKSSSSKSSSKSTSSASKPKRKTSTSAKSKSTKASSAKKRKK